MFHVKQQDFDVIVVGGGHAGCEAVLSAHRLGVHAALVTHKFNRIGEMSCNPAIGGLGKGHLVREIDALDGAMARVADASGIQFRLLNRKKGPAVQGPRAQADRAVYRREMQSILGTAPDLAIIEGEVIDFLLDGERVCGLVLSDGAEIRCRSLVLTTGTFLGGVIHIGEHRKPGGRMGDSAATRLATRMRSFGLPIGRLKTGTPPRLNGKTIDWTELKDQPGDNNPTLFSFLSKGVNLRQVPCGITWTNAKTHEIIRNNIDKSAMYGGGIEGVGPRYCPSIEDKVHRFAEKDSHQVFLEPESLEDDIIYPNGISTSLPADIQSEYVRSIKGMSQVEILQPGYAIEYDYIDPRCLTGALQVRDLDGLFLAGQINGTTGYEEAAAQGLVAGLNAARQALSLDLVRFSRGDSYIGVLIDDLITKGVTEPYRMFTSRAEYRLSLRADNADQRLTSRGISLGLVGEDRKVAFERKLEKLTNMRGSLKKVAVTPTEAIAAGLSVRLDGRRRSGLDIITLPEISKDQIELLWPELELGDPDVFAQVQIDARYSHYVERQARDNQRLRAEETLQIPTFLDFNLIPGLSNELAEKLTTIRPETLGQAGRIEGMTPAALTLLLAWIRREERLRAI